MRLFKHHPQLVAYLIFCAALIGVFWINNTRRDRDIAEALERQHQVNVIVCVQASDLSQAVIELVAALAPPVEHQPGEDQATKERLDKVNQDRAEARRISSTIFRPPPCLEDLGIDTDHNGKPDPDKIPK